MNKYFVIDANGKKYTRNSKRTYTHVVLYRESKDASLRLAGRRDTFLDDNYWYHHAFIDGSSQWLERKPWETEDNYKARVEYVVERSRKALRGAKTPEEWHEAIKEERIARIEAKDFSQWYVEGWCGRHDLAVKLAHKTACRELVVEAIILPVFV